MPENHITPLVSVIIPTHNRADLLPGAVTSVLAQTYTNIEVIVVNDGSSDGTESVVNEFLAHDQRVRYLSHEVPKGACAARNIGIKAATGSLVTFLDDDDRISPDRLELMVNYYDDAYAFVCSRYSESLEEILFPKARGEIKTKTLSLTNLLNRNYVGSSVLISKQKLLAVNGFDENMKARQDYDLWVRVAETFGKGLQISPKTYFCDKSNERVRISNSRSRRRGVIQFYKKHAHLMNRGQRKNAIVACLEANNINPGVVKLLFLCTWRNKKKVFKLVRENFLHQKHA